jgi:hypothetical protein
MLEPFPHGRAGFGAMEHLRRNPAESIDEAAIFEVVIRSWSRR